MRSPIFIVGANRSGTTLLRLILNAHSHIAIPEEVVYLNSKVAGVTIERWKNPGFSEGAYAAFIRDFVYNKCEPLHGIEREAVIDAILSDTPYNLKKPYQHVLESWAAHHGKGRWGEKTPGNLFYSDILLEMFPDARFIHVVRDPRAGVSSMMNTSFFPSDIVFNALSRHKFMTKGRAILERSVPESQRIILRYEDLVLKPEETVRHLCDFIDEPFEESMMEFYQDSRRYMKQAAKDSFNKAATRPISSDKLDKWKKKLTRSEIAQIQAVCKKEMAEFGYLVEKSPLNVSVRAELIIKKMYWALQLWRNRDVRHFTVKSPMFARFQARLRRFRNG